MSIMQPRGFCESTHVQQRLTPNKHQRRLAACKTKGVMYCEHFLIYMCQKAPFKALKQPAVQATNDINRTTHTMLIDCLEQAGEEEGCTHVAALHIAAWWVSLPTSDWFHPESAVPASGSTFQ